MSPAARSQCRLEITLTDQRKGGGDDEGIVEIRRGGNRPTLARRRSARRSARPASLARGCSAPRAGRRRHHRRTPPDRQRRHRWRNPRWQSSNASWPRAKSPCTATRRSVRGSSARTTGAVAVADIAAATTAPRTAPSSTPPRGLDIGLQSFGDQRNNSLAESLRAVIYHSFRLRRPLVAVFVPRGQLTRPLGMRTTRVPRGLGGRQTRC